MCATKSSGSHPVAALVVLEYGPKSPERAVAAHIDELRPPKAMADTARRAFAGLGFQVTDVVGNSFSIEAPIDHFNEMFNVELQVGSDGAVTVLKGKTARSLELPLATLPKEVRPLIRAVTFSEPPAFGPGNP